MNPFEQTSEFNDTQQKIIDAAIRCVKQWGTDKTNLNDIAKEAGVTRPTVYSYFPNRDDVIRTALLQSGYNFAQRLFEFMNQFTNTKDRILETLLFALEELPKEPYLAIITRTDLSSHINADALSDIEGQAICLHLFQEIFKYDLPNEADLIEITEFTTRLMLSLLIIQGPIVRTREQQKAFLERRLLPAIGLEKA
jgi:AcrR family transcriptional regulator